MPKSVRAQYNDQFRRIKNLINKYENFGLEVQFNLSSPVKNPTMEDVKNLKAISAKRIRNESYGVDFRTGEQLNFNAYMRQIKEYDETIIYESSIVISNFKINMRMYNEYAQSIINDWLTGMIQRVGEDVVAEMLQRGAEEGLIPDYSVMYQEQLLRKALAALSNLIDLPPFSREDLADFVEYDENFSLPE